MVVSSVDVVDYLPCTMSLCTSEAARPCDPAVLYSNADRPIAISSVFGSGALPPGDRSGPVHFDLVQLDPGIYGFTAAPGRLIVMTISADGLARFSCHGAQAREALQLSATDCVEIRLPAVRDVLEVDARQLGNWRVRFTGKGSVNILGIQVTPARFDHSGVVPACMAPDLPAAFGLSSDDASVLVNGEKAGFIQCRWIQLRQHLPGSERDYLQIISEIELALLYVEHLSAGGRALDDFIAIIESVDEAGVASRRTLHDCLLGALNDDALRARFLANTLPLPGELPLTREGLYQTYSSLAGKLAGRPYCPVLRGADEEASTAAAAAFDFDSGWLRSDYVRYIPFGALTRAATNPDGTMRVGGAPATGFNVKRHIGAGIELALKARSSTGADCPAERYEPEGMRFMVPAGVSLESAYWGPQARWCVDFSVATRLGGADRQLDDFRFVLSVDTDPGLLRSAYRRFVLTRPCVLYHPAYGELDVGRAWLLMTPSGRIALKKDGSLAGGLGDEIDEAAGDGVSQNCINFGQAFMRRLLGRYTVSSNPDAFGSGVFEFKLEAFDRRGVLLLDNIIQVVVR